jgi:hypothetical protein
LGKGGDRKEPEGDDSDQRDADVNKVVATGR